MADRVLFIGWGATVRGAEERAIEVFNEALGVYGRMQQDGRIEGFDVMLLDPNGDLNGCILIRGSAAQLAAMREDGEFRRITIDAALIVEDLRLIGGYANDGVSQQMALYEAAISKVPQRT
ncbi:MAG: hypothetical protein ACLP8S_20670 [Solirubrobacteraceae bacterium]